MIKQGGVLQIRVQVEPLDSTSSGCDGEEWIYDYKGYVISPWPNGVNQRLAMVGSIVRTIPHASGSGGTSPAGVVCSWIAAKQDDPAA